MTPEVERPLNRVGEYACDAIRNAWTAASYAALVIAGWFEHKALIFEARADANDPDLIPQEEEL